MNLEQLKYPIGKFRYTDDPDPATLSQWSDTIADFPNRVQLITQNLSTEELNWQYRPDGWTIKQVVHHCADSHIHAWARFKWTLTEDTPVIKSYHEDRWAELSDAQDDDIRSSIMVLTGLHTKWSKLIKQFSPEELAKEFIHSEYNKRFTLKKMVGLYAWHSLHHLVHIEQALKYKGKFIF